MAKKKRKSPRTLMTRIAEMLREDETIDVEEGCFSDDSGCWVYVQPLNVPINKTKFTSYSIGFDGKGQKIDGVRVFMNEVIKTVKTNEIKP